MLWVKEGAYPKHLDEPRVKKKRNGWDTVGAGGWGNGEKSGKKKREFTETESRENHDSGRVSRECVRVEKDEQAMRFIRMSRSRGSVALL